MTTTLGCYRNQNNEQVQDYQKSEWKNETFNIPNSQQKIIFLLS